MLHQDLIIVGLTGSIGMGKSTTAEIFRKEGIPVHDADRCVHELYQTGAANLIEEAFPGATHKGVVDRKKLGKQVIGNSIAMKKLEAIIHPLVKNERDKFLKEAEALGAYMAVLDIPLLYETGADALCDYVIVVSTSKQEQQRRVLSRPDMSLDKFNKILASQLADEEKRERADFIVDSSISIEDATNQVRQIIKQIKQDQSALN